MALVSLSENSLTTVQPVGAQLEAVLALTVYSGTGTGTVEGLTGVDEGFHVCSTSCFGLRFSHPDWVPMQTRQAGLEGTGEVSLRDLVRETLRMRPTRIIVGEVRAAECLDLLLALNAGLPGMATIHANSAREALVKLCTLPLLAGENISARFVVPTVASSVDLVVHLGLDNSGTRRVNEIVAVPGRTENDIVEIEPVFVRHGGDLVHAGGVPARLDTYERAGIDVHRLLRGDD